MESSRKLRGEERLNFDVRKLNKELIGKEFTFFSEDYSILDIYSVVRVTDKYILLRKIERDVIKDREVEIIEFLALNFPESEEYKFSFEEWKNLWIKYGGWLPKDFKPPASELSIKEARELFSRLPSKIELFLDYYHSAKYDQDFFIFLKNPNIYTLIAFAKYIETYFNLDNFCATANIGNKDNEIEMAKVREKLFGKPIPLELLDELERSRFLKEFLEEYYKAKDANERNKIENYLLKLAEGRSIKPNNDFEKIISFILEKSAGGTTIITSENRFNPIFDPTCFPPNIFQKKDIRDIPPDELDSYLDILLKINFLSPFNLYSKDIYKEIIEKILYSKYLYILLKEKPEIIFAPPTNIIPYSFFIKYLLKYTKKILELKNKEFADKIKIPKFIFVNTEANYLRYIIREKYNNNFLKLFEELKGYIDDIKLEDLTEKITNSGFDEEKKRFYRYLIESSIWLKNKLITFFEKINTLEELEKEIDEKRKLIFAFLDDAFGNQFATYNTFYIMAYFAIRDILRGLKTQEADSTNFNNMIDRIIRKIMPSGNLLPSHTSIQDLFTIMGRNLRIMEAGRNILIPLLPILKTKSFEKLPFRHRLTHHLIESEEDKILFKRMLEFNKRKLEILKLLAQKLAPHFAEYIKQHPNLV
jgi:hypothetical protein